VHSFTGDGYCLAHWNISDGLRAHPSIRLQITSTFLLRLLGLRIASRGSRIMVDVDER
jgi:hypothetical protein